MFGILKIMYWPGRGPILLNNAQNTKKYLWVLAQSCSNLFKSNSTLLKIGGIFKKVLAHPVQFVQTCSKMFGILKKVLVGPGPVLLNFAQNCSKVIQLSEDKDKYWGALANFVQFCSKWLNMAQKSRKVEKVRNNK